MERENDIVTVFQILGDVCYLHSVNMRHGHLNGDRNVDDCLTVSGRLPYIEDSVADLKSVLRFSTGEALRRILKAVIGTGLLGELLQKLRTVNGNLLDFLLAHFEYLLALSKGSGVVDMDDGVLYALQSLKGFLDDMLTGLSQYLDGNIVGNEVFLNKAAQESILGLTGCREAYLDFLEADFHESLVELNLLIKGHRNDESLISVTKVYAAPGGGLLGILLLCPAHITDRRHKVAGAVFGTVRHHVLLYGVNLHCSVLLGFLIGYEIIKRLVRDRAVGSK